MAAPVMVAAALPRFGWQVTFEVAWSLAELPHCEAPSLSRLGRMKLVMPAW
jgi:hypothetical protein